MPGSPWVVFGKWINSDIGSPIISFRATWTVPPAPRTNSVGKVIALWHGIQSQQPGKTFVLQAVLQWEQQSADRWHWFVASYYVFNDDVLKTSQIRKVSHQTEVNPGDVLVGIISRTSQSGTLFSYNCQFEGYPHSSIDIDGEQLTHCEVVLEARHINKCSDYPDVDLTTFHSISLQTTAGTPAIDWKPEIVPENIRCDEHADVVNGTANPGAIVDIYYTRFPITDFGPVYPQGSPGQGIGGYDLKSTADEVFPFDFDGSGQQDHLVVYRPGTGTIWILKNTKGTFTPVYQQGDPGSGIGGFDLTSADDRVFAFDYDGSGKVDHLVLYRPGTGIISILKNTGEIPVRAARGPRFLPVYPHGDPGSGIGGFDLKSRDDRMFAYDYNSSGKLDHLVVYRPGTGTIWILQNNAGSFSPVYQQGDPGSGIGGFDLKTRDDRVFAFDFESTGKLDHLVLYRPGTGMIRILKKTGGLSSVQEPSPHAGFSAVYPHGDPGSGIGGYDLLSDKDKLFPFDFDNVGSQDHLVLYRPGTGTIWILQNDKGVFSPVYAQGDPGRGIGGFDLADIVDRAFAFDYDGIRNLNYLTLYRPGTGTISILKNRKLSARGVRAQMLGKRVQPHSVPVSVLTTRVTP